MAGFFDEIDSGDFDNYSDLNNSVFANPDSNASLDPSNGDSLIMGDGTVNYVPLTSDKPQSSAGSPYSGIGNFLGSIGTTVQNLPAIAQSAGTLVGTAQHNIAQAGTNYTNAQQAAASGNQLSTWWQYASTTDKLMIGLAVVGILIAMKAGD